MSQDTVPIPQPPGLPLVGNALQFDSEFPLGTNLRLAEQYGTYGSVPVNGRDITRPRMTNDHCRAGEIYRLNLVGRQIVFVSSWALVNETCDETRFVKGVNTVLGVCGY
jgi:cytochrome P450/NADPH-cytochrome P450 reductase